MPFHGLGFIAVPKLCDVSIRSRTANPGYRFAAKRQRSLNRATGRRGGGILLSVAHSV